jgi:hypothetical protein
MIVNKVDRHGEEQDPDTNAFVSVQQSRHVRIIKGTAPIQEEPMMFCWIHSGRFLSWIPELVFLVELKNVS